MEISIDELPEDSLFDIAKKLNHESISKLCQTNKLFNSFCRDFEGDLFKYLLMRDFGIDHPKEGARSKYYEYLGSEEHLYAVLRQNGAGMMADIMELESISVDRRGHIPWKTALSDTENYIIMAPSDDVWTRYAHYWDRMSLENVFRHFGSELMLSHVGTFNKDTRIFSNLAGYTFPVVEGAIAEVPYGAQIKISSKLTVYIIQDFILHEDQELGFSDVASIIMGYDEAF